MLTPEVLEVARGAKGFMPDAEGLALYAAGLEAGRAVHAALLEVGTYCGKSAVYLGAAAREAGTVLFTVDHHRGSEENQAGWDHHDLEVVDPQTGRMDTLPFFRRTIEAAGLEDCVIGVVGHSEPVAAAWATPIAFLFVDGGHSEAIAMADYEGWSGHVVAGGELSQNLQAVRREGKLHVPHLDVVGPRAVHVARIILVARAESRVTIAHGGGKS